MAYVLVKWINDPGFSWSILSRHEVYTKKLVVGAVVKATWGKNKLPAQVLAYEGMMIIIILYTAGL